jgi:hypothetical protein
MNKYQYKIEFITEASLFEEEQDIFLLYLKFKLDSISSLPEKIEKKIEKIIEMDPNLEIIIKKFKIEEEI